MNVADYLNKKGLRWKEQRGQAVMNCPFCNDKENKFAIGLSNGAFNCFHLNTCGERGSFYDFQKMLGDDPVNNDKMFVREPKKKSYKLPTAKVSPPTNPVISYLKGRGFTDDTIKYFNIGASGNAVMIPFYRNGILVNVKYRDISDKKKMWTEKDAEPILFNRDNVLDESLVVCEGEYDAMAFYQYGIAAVSVPMGAKNFEWVENEWEYLETFKSIVLCFDMDQAGREAVAELALKIGRWKCRLVELPYKDANECLLRGVSKDKIALAIDNAKEISPPYLSRPSDFADKIITMFKSPRELEGVSTPWEKLTYMLKGWRKGEVTIWTGRNGSGKSTILNQVILGLSEQKLRSCILSLEMPPDRYIRWAVMQYLEIKDPVERMVRETLDYFDETITVINRRGSILPGMMFECFEYAARRYGVGHFFIDSLMKIKLPGKDEYKEQDQFISEVSSFAKNFGVHVHLVAHPRKTQTDNEKPGKVDIKGSGQLTDEADNILMMWRPPDGLKEAGIKAGKSVPDAAMYVLKNREFGFEGNIKFSFNPESKKFSD